MMTVVITAIFLILASVIYRNWNEISSYDFRFNYLYLAISFVAFIAAFSMMAIGWGLILTRLRAGLSTKKVLRIWFLSQFTRWLPGNFWSVVSLFYLAQGVPKATVALSALLALVFNLVTGIITMLVFFHSWPTDLIKGYPVAYILLPVLLITWIFLYPNRLRNLYDNKLWRYLLRKFGKEDFLEILPEYQLLRKDLATILVYYVVCWCVSGIALYFFVISLAHVPLDGLPGCILIFATAWVVSFLAFVTPGGLGIKESITTLMLAQYLPVGVATVISLALRIWMIVCELFCLLLTRVFLREEEQS